MLELPDPEWYLDNVLIHASPGDDSLHLGPAAQWTAWWAEQSRNELAQFGSGFVLSPGERAAAGVSRQTARTRVRKGEWVNSGYGFVAPMDIADDRSFVVARRRHALRATAAARRRPGHSVSGRSAAILHGLPTFRVPLRPELTEPYAVALGPGRGTSHVFSADLTADDQIDWFGVPATSVPRTVVDLARHDRWDAIMAADAALHEGLVDVAAIDRALAGAVGWPGVRQAREVLALADARAESPLESLTRLRLHDDGFPIPDLQVWVGRDRVDMLFDDQRLILEIDGLEKYVDDALQVEKLRETRLRRHGYRVERVTWDDILKNWPQTAAWLRRLLRLPVSGG
jgi:very-short-patch-repair endonuclease